MGSLLYRAQNLKSLANKTALITGVTGMDGSHLADFLIEKGYVVCGTYKDESSLDKIQHLIQKIKLYKIDITEPDNNDKILKDIVPDEIYNLAAISSGGGGWDDSTLVMNVNGQASVNFLVSSLKCMPKVKFFQATSSEMYKGSPAECMINEDSPHTPVTPYGVSKAYIHNTIKMYRNSGYFACNGILFTHESERRGNNFLVKKIVKNVVAIKKGTLNKFTLGNLDSKRDWGSSYDYVQAMWLILQQDSPDDYVIAMSKLHSVADVCSVAFKYVGIHDWKKYVDIDEKFSHTIDTALLGNNCKLRKLTGWSPNISFSHMIEKMVEYEL